MSKTRDTCKAVVLFKGSVEGRLKGAKNWCCGNNEKWAKVSHISLFFLFQNDKTGSTAPSSAAGSLGRHGRFFAYSEHLVPPQVLYFSDAVFKSGFVTQHFYFQFQLTGVKGEKLHPNPFQSESKILFCFLSCFPDTSFPSLLCNIFFWWIKGWLFVFHSYFHNIGNFQGKVFPLISQIQVWQIRR